jgi:hypothetical protein
VRIIVTGLIAQHPHIAGLTWHYLHYVLGLERLGHQVYYLEDSGQWPYTVDGGSSGTEWVAENCDRNLEYLDSVLRRYGLGDRWAYRFPKEESWFGLTERRRVEVVDSADLLLNVSGSLVRPDQYRRVPRLVYVDTDPIFTQVRIEAGETAFAARVAAHDVHFTFGESLAPCSARYRWLPTRQPVVLSEWIADEPVRTAFTTVMNWTSYAPLRHQGRTYGQKDLEFLRFVELPSRVPEQELEVALGDIQHLDWATVRTLRPQAGGTAPTISSGTVPELLTSTGWRVVFASETCGDLDAYRSYIQRSAAEWSIAKHGYVTGRPGWFSDRSACYLAAGRPVVVQNTGLDGWLPLGEGILAFETIEEAADLIRRIASDPGRHGRAAREIAREYFDHRVVLTALLDRAAAATAKDTASGASTSPTDR